MTDIFSSLEKFGISDILKNEVAAEVTREATNMAALKAREPKEAKEEKVDLDKYIFSKKFDCPCCNFEFSSYVPKDKRARLEKIDFDLRPVYTPVDPLFYDIVLCPMCGWAALRSLFDRIKKDQISAIHQKISPSFRYHEYPKELDADMAIERYNMALVNTLVKGGSSGEKAYTFMKLNWLYRMKENTEAQSQFSALALKNFMEALEKEHMPIMGLGHDTISYIVGVLNLSLGNKEEGFKSMSEVIISKTSSERLKEMARDIKNGLLQIPSLTT